MSRENPTWPTIAPCPECGAPSVADLPDRHHVTYYYAHQTTAVLWNIIREKERNAYEAANSLNVAELDARLSEALLEIERLRRAGVLPVVSR